MWKKIVATEALKTTAPAAAPPVNRRGVACDIRAAGRSPGHFAPKPRVWEFCPAAKPRRGNCGAATRSWKKFCGNSPRCCWTWQLPWDYRQRLKRLVDFLVTEATPPRSLCLNFLRLQAGDSRLQAKVSYSKAHPHQVEERRFSPVLRL
jgi:hypothetical protein